MSAALTPTLRAFMQSRAEIYKNHMHSRRLAVSVQKAAADIHSYVNGQRSTSAEPKLEAAEVKANWAEGPR